MERQLKKMIQEDFNRLLKRERLNTTAEIERLIFVQSVEGHAHNGHGAFRQKRFVNVTISDIVRALGLEPADVKAKRQKLIDDIFHWVELAARDRQPDELVDVNGKPLLGVPQHSEYTVNPRDILMGLYIGGERDNSDVREMVEKEYNVEIGGGGCYLVDTDVMREMDLDAEILSHTTNADKIDEYRKRGLIVDVPDDEVDDDKIRYLYIRDRLGRGHSDDMAMITAGMLYGRDAALGVWLSDAIDTLEKYSSKYEDQDSTLADYCKTTDFYEDSWDEAAKVITYLSVNPDNDDRVPDSSMRYFLLVDNTSGRCAFTSHIDFIEGIPTTPVLLSHSRILNTEFYSFVRSAMQKYSPRIQKDKTAKLPSVSIANFANHNFITLNQDADTDGIIEQVTTNGAEYVVLIDDEGVPTGIVSGNDLLRIAWSMYKSKDR